jgi:hypothetical protein
MVQKSTLAFVIALLISSTLAGQFPNLRPLDPLPVVTTTGEKPQSKVWQHANNWWNVMADHSGTHLWRLEGKRWTKALTLLQDRSTKADCKQVGDVMHIMLFAEKNNSYLVSLQYDSINTTYTSWSERSSRTPIAFVEGSETASLDIDGSGRMWVASDAPDHINVRWSDPPYKSFSEPIVLVQGINDDDICGIIAMPGKIGVMWSNQTTKRFGFRTHADGASPTAWSADEKPGAQSAQNVGGGMAEDHVNMALGSDGTLYCAVKTNYETLTYPKLALLVRRPNGSWDPLYEVTRAPEGTRPIVLLNEEKDKLRVVYTEKEFVGSNILYRESSLSTISFSAAHTLIKGRYNDVTSMKNNFTSEVVIMASDSTNAVGVLASDIPADDLFVFDAYPNPFGNTATIRLSLPYDSDYRIQLYDAKALWIPIQYTGTATYGQMYYFDLNVDNMEMGRGLFMVRLQTNRGYKTLKLLRAY